MATISKTKFRIFHSLGFKVAISFIIVVAIILVLANTYFLTAARDMVFSSKHTMLENQSAVISTALSVIDILNLDNVNQVMNLLDVSSLSRVVVVSAHGEILYDAARSSASIENLSQRTDVAMDGNSAFYGKFSESAFRCSLYTPIYSGSAISGVLVLQDTDISQGQMLVALQTTIKSVTVIVSIVACAVIALLVYIIISKINMVTDGIKPVSEGDYNYRVKVVGNDELSELASEFNMLIKRLEDTEDVRRRFVADASHELKTPLASIRLLSDSILQNDAMDADMMREFVEDIGGESERLARTTERLLALTRLDSNVEVKRGAADVCIIADNAIRMLELIADAKNVHITPEFTDGCVVYASEDELHQIVVNLIENAIKYNVKGGLVMVKASHDNKNVVFTVEDTGIGIPADDLPNIFDRFYRVDKARSREAGGSGLGLAIVKDTVTVLKGTVTAERREECGTKFTMTLPLYRQEEI